VKHILVVDDERRIAEIVRDYLERAGYRVTTAGNGVDALAVARAHQPDLIVLDLGLPQMDGLDFTRTLRKHSSVPIIMLTARVDESDTLIGLELGADDYVTKPFSPKELVARVRAVFRRIDAAPERGGIIRAGEVVAIKPKAFQLLAFLIRHPGQVFTRDQLLEHVWGYDYGGETRTVDVHIHWLRSRIEADPADPAFIHTVRGVGYVFRRPT